MKIALIVLGVAALLAAGLVGVWVYVVQNVETPAYETLRSEGEIEIRRYPPMVVAEIARDGPRREALSRGFSPLAGYIFAREREGPSIAMTAPVTQRPGEADSVWSVGFIMPAGAEADDLPAPSDPAIELRDWPAREMAAIRFSGHASDGDLEANEARLRAWLTDAGLSPAGPAIYAYYNDPFTPGFLRRNEVMIPLASAQEAG